MSFFTITYLQQFVADCEHYHGNKRRSSPPPKSVDVEINAQKEAPKVQTICVDGGDTPVIRQKTEKPRSRSKKTSGSRSKSPVRRSSTSPVTKRKRSKKDLLELPKTE